MQIRYDIKEVGNQLLTGLYAQNQEATTKLFELLGTEAFQTLAKIMSDHCSLALNQIAFMQVMTQEDWQAARVQQTALQSVFIGLAQIGDEWSLGKHELQTAAKGESDESVATS